MSSDDGTSTYAPRSPDLSSFYSSGPTQPASQLHSPSQQGSGQYKLHPPSYAYGSSYAPPMQFSTVPSQLDHHHPTSQFSVFSPPSQPCYSSSSPPPNPVPYQLSTPAQNLYKLQSLPHFSQTRSSQDYSLPIPLADQPRVEKGQPTYPSQASSSSSASAPHDPDMPPRRVAAAPPPPVIEPSPVKTKFPTARIKRIMQADEEVGKVAQQTPIAVGKALELFMIQMVSSSADVAKEKGSKRVTASMLKQVVETDDQWDFLRDIVSRVEHEKEGAKSKSKADSESDDDSEPKKRSRGGSRRKKS
ncbi:hypothetical protein E4U43_004022 [Claviceps pusilla]|uniref:NCT transcriptional regulatory complex subunit A n=1 Tax=Claviceps pusilla TaxID=123648 RepID=A0A9P7SU75_9HYPO|nr:hypothetical protein E4U43_004022 [Claviceps pusilla]